MWILIFVLLSTACSWAGETPIEVLESETDSVERRLEMGRQELLVARKADQESVLAPFTTDGCSGGLTAGWEYLSARLEEFHAHMGAEPPWESCCVTHDRAYHTGGKRYSTAQESFLDRKKADLALKACVLATGRQQQPILTAKYDLTPREVEVLYSAVASLMYRAVRMGGMPCTGLSWRWGYGWPACK